MTVKKVADPDSKPATRGFVKCVARQLHYHHHEQGSSVGYTFVGIAFGITAWIIEIIASATPGGIYHVPEAIYWATVAFTLALAFNAMDHLDSQSTEDPSEDTYLENIITEHRYRKRLCDSSSDGTGEDD